MLVITGEDATELGAGSNIVRFRQRPGAEYYGKLQKNFDSATPSDEKLFMDGLRSAQKIQIVASASVATSIANVDGKPHVFLANFTGLRGNADPVPTPQTGVQVRIEGAREGHGFFVPFLGEMSRIEGVAQRDTLTFRLPPIQRGAVFWWEP